MATGTAKCKGLTMKLTTLLLIALTIAVPAYATKDKSASYQMGTFISSSVAADGTITNTLHGDGTTVAGSVYANHIAAYTIKMADGHMLTSPAKNFISLGISTQIRRHLSHKKPVTT
jgi:hypothetical protein